MKKILIALCVVLGTGILATSSIKQKDAKPMATFYANPFSGKNNIGSAD
jgi:hypothetical protein